jgi:pyruvate,orthophosphate dikinase
MIASCAVITDHGGSTSHAAVVSRALGVPCIVGCGDGVVAALAGRTVTVDGTSGTVFTGSLEVVSPDESDDPDLATLCEWARELAPVQVLRRDGEVPATALDLNALDGGEDPSRIAALIGAARCVRGRVLESDAGLEAALAAGVECLVTEHLLPSLLYTIHRAGRAARAGSESISEDSV